MYRSELTACNVVYKSESIWFNELEIVISGSQCSSKVGFYATRAHKPRVFIEKAYFHIHQGALNLELCSWIMYKKTVANYWWVNCLIYVNFMNLLIRWMLLLRIWFAETIKRRGEGSHLVPFLCAYNYVSALTSITFNFDLDLVRI